MKIRITAAAVLFALAGTAFAQTQPADAPKDAPAMKGEEKSEPKLSLSIGPGEMVTLTYTPTAAQMVSGIQQDFRGANNYRPNVVGDPYGSKNSTTGYFNAANVVIPADPSQVFGNAPRNSVRGPWFWQLDFVASKNFKLPFGSQTNLQARIEAG